jgi:hypothetical protein
MLRLRQLDHRVYFDPWDIFKGNDRQTAFRTIKCPKIESKEDQATQI